MFKLSHYLTINVILHYQSLSEAIMYIFVFCFMLLCICVYVVCTAQIRPIKTFFHIKDKGSSYISFIWSIYNIYIIFECIFFNNINGNLLRNCNYQSKDASFTENVF